MNSVAKGRNAENKVVALLNEWAGEKVFRRAGLGQKGQDIVCLWTRWKYQVEVKLQEVSHCKISQVFSKEALEKDYDPDRLWFFYRNNCRIWVALPNMIVAELENHWGRIIFNGQGGCFCIPHSLYVFEAGPLLRKLIDPEKIYGDSPNPSC